VVLNILYVFLNYGCTILFEVRLYASRSPGIWLHYIGQWAQETRDSLLALTLILNAAVSLAWGLSVRMHLWDTLNIESVVWTSSNTLLENIAVALLV
jgi:hypothetical protein